MVAVRRRSGVLSVVSVAALLVTPMGPVALAAPAHATPGSIRSVAPRVERAGRTAVISGSGFRHVRTVRFHGRAAHFRVVSSHRIRARVPAAATSGRVTVTTSAGTLTSARPLTVAPTLTSFTPTSGGVHTVVTLTGTGFTSPASVSFNGSSVTGTVVSATKITASLPAAATTGPVKLTTAGSTLTGGTFTVTTGLALSTTTGPPTSSISVYGSGFGSHELVDLYYGLTDVAVVSTTGTGTFTYAGFTVPATAQPGTGWISAEGRHSGDGAQTSFLVRTDWTQLGYKNSGGRDNAYENTLSPSTVSGLGQAWSYTAGSNIESSVAVAGGLAYVLSATSGLSAVDATTGVMRWTYAVGGGTSTPAVSNGVLYVGSINGSFYALNATTGALIWSRAIGADIFSSPVVANGLVYFGASDHNLYALKVTTGATEWAATTGDQIDSSPAVADGVVYIGSIDDKMYAFDAASGALDWSYATAGYAEAPPIVYNGVVYFGSDDKYLYALNAHSGALIWRYLTANEIFNSAAAANGLVFTGSQDGSVYALDATTGTLAWSSALSGGAGGSGLAVADGVVYAATSDGVVYALDSSFGGKLWTYTGGNSFSFDSPTVVNGTLYIGNNDDKLRAFTLAAGLSPAAMARPAQAMLRPDRSLPAR